MYDGMYIYHWYIYRYIHIRIWWIIWYILKWVRMRFRRMSPEWNENGDELVVFAKDFIKLKGLVTKWWVSEWWSRIGETAALLYWTVERGSRWSTWTLICIATERSEKKERRERSRKVTTSMWSTCVHLGKFRWIGKHCEGKDLDRWTVRIKDEKRETKWKE